jgi:Sulfotransferase family
VGCPKSGTTLLRRMVDAHPLVAIPNEQHWLPKWFEQRNGVTPEGLATPELISKLLEYERFSRMCIDREKLERLMESDGPIEYSSFVSGVFDLYGKARGKPLVGDKTPSYVRRIGTLHALWPKAKFVHLIRDGRDVYLSTINWNRAFKITRRFAAWSQDPVTTAAFWWEWNVRLGRESGGLLEQDLYCELRHEALIANPPEECAKLCKFLGVPYEDAMLDFRKSRERTQPGLDAKKARQPVISRLEDWRRQMPRADIERFEAAVGDLLDELGYARSVPHPSLEALKHASRIRTSFRQDVLARGGRLPKVWER